MKLKFPPHFQSRIDERNLNIDHVKRAIREPDIKQDTFEGRTKVQKKIGDKVIKVIYFKDAFRDKKEEYIIITAYYL
ncbi:MAG: hypothetical protein WCC74_02365 [Minisyncoccia bacterium]